VLKSLRNLSGFDKSQNDIYVVGWLVVYPIGIDPGSGRVVRRDPGRKRGNRRKMVDKKRKV
jgi:hypothetical protein